MVEPISTTAAIVTAIVGFMAAMSKQYKGVAVLLIVLALYFFGLFSTLPPFIWIIIIIVMFLWIFKWKN